jgi:hypothetical protein
MATTADSKNKVLSCFASPWWCIALALSSNTWRWRPALPALVQEFCCCDSMSSCSVLLLAFCFSLVTAEGVRLVAAWRVDQTRFSFPPGVYWWRDLIHDWRSSGCVSDRCVFNDGSIFCGSSQSMCASGLLLIRGILRVFYVGSFWFVIGGAWRWRVSVDSSSTV